MRANPVDDTQPKKAYACAQYSELIDIVQFAAHIASHGCVYNRADIVAILTMAVDCMRELLLAGQKIRMGDLGDFYVSIQSTGADDASKFNPAINVKRLKVNWTCGKHFQDLLQDAEFNLVPTRRAAQKLVKALKAGDTTVDLSDRDSNPGKCYLQRFSRPPQSTTLPPLQTSFSRECFLLKAVQRYDFISNEQIVCRFFCHKIF